MALLRRLLPSSDKEESFGLDSRFISGVVREEQKWLLLLAWGREIKLPGAEVVLLAPSKCCRKRSKGKLRQAVTDHLPGLLLSS